jgi:four helix bundle protein
MALVKRFEDLVAWQEARKLNVQIYALTSNSIFAKDYEFKHQLRSAALSGMSNIAEGFDCDSKVEFARFLGIARRSIVEVQSLLYAALDVSYITQTELDTYYAQANKAKAIIGGLKSSLLRSKPSHDT